MHKHFFDFLAFVAAFINSDIDKITSAELPEYHPAVIFAGYCDTFAKYGFCMTQHPVRNYMYLAADYNKEFAF